MMVSYHDPNPILPLFVQAQEYYAKHSIPTKIKACAFMTTEEVISMAGVDAVSVSNNSGESIDYRCATANLAIEQLTLPAEVIQELSSSSSSDTELESRSVFLSSSPSSSGGQVKMSYINDKTKFDRAFTCDGRGLAKTEDVSAHLPFPSPPR